MPLYWTIDSKQRLFTGFGECEVTLDEAMSLLEALAGAKALTYRKLFDGRAVQSTMTGDELLAVCAKIRTYHEQGRVGSKLPLIWCGVSCRTALSAPISLAQSEI